MNDIEFTFDTRLDTDMLHELYEGDKEHASVVFEHFLQTVGIQLREIDENFRPDNIEIFRQKIHKLKPTFSFVGLSSLTNKAELIEDLCKQPSQYDIIKEAYDDFSRCIEEFIPVIENELLRLKD